MSRILIFFFISTVSLWAKMVVAVSLEPQAWIVRSVGGDRVETVVMVPPGASAHVYEPKPAQMAQLSKAQLYIANGVEFERVWLERFRSTNPKLTVVASDERIKKLPMSAHHHDDHDEDEHDHDAEAQRPDTHIWLSAGAVALQARAVAEALSKSDPASSAYYWSNYQKTAAQIALLDSEIAQQLAPYAGRGFMVFHPAWGYFANDYNLEQLAIEVEGKEPKPAELKELIATAKEHGVKAIFIQSRQSPKGAEVVAQAIGARVIVLDPLSSDWPAMMRDTAAKLAGAMREQSVGR